MKKKCFMAITAFITLWLFVASLLVVRPCGYARLVLVNSWSVAGVEVTIDNGSGYGQLIWKGKVPYGAPVKQRVYIGGDTSYHLQIRNLETGERREEDFGYDTPGLSQINMFFIGNDSMNYHSWSMPFWRGIFTYGADVLSCQL